MRGFESQFQRLDTLLQIDRRTPVGQALLTVVILALQLGEFLFLFLERFAQLKEFVFLPDVSHARDTNADTDQEGLEHGSKLHGWF